MIMLRRIDLQFQITSEFDMVAILVCHLCRRHGIQDPEIHTRIQKFIILEIKRRLLLKQRQPTEAEISALIEKTIPAFQTISKV